MNTTSKHMLTAVLAMATAWTGITASAQKKQQEEQFTRVKTTFVEGTQANAKEGSALVADGHKWTKWCVDAPGEMPYHVVLDATEATAMKAYALVTAEDTHYYPMRNPISWNIYGSNDRKEWTLVEQVKYNRRLDDQNEQTYTFRLKDAKPWRYYKFEFTRMADGTRLQLSEIELYK